MGYMVGLGRQLCHFCHFRTTQVLADKRRSKYVVLIVLSLVLIISSAPIIMIMNGFLSYASSPPALTAPSSFTNSNSFSDPESLSSQISILVSRPLNTSSAGNGEGNNNNGGGFMAQAECPELKIIQPDAVSVENETTEDTNGAQALSHLLQRNTTIDTDSECGYTLDAGKLSAPALDAGILEDRRH
jgi:hypothetical protein